MNSRPLLGAGGCIDEFLHSHAPPPLHRWLFPSSTRYVLRMGNDASQSACKNRHKKQPQTLSPVMLLAHSNSRPKVLEYWPIIRKRLGPNRHRHSVYRLSTKIATPFLPHIALKSLYLHRIMPKGVNLTCQADRSQIAVPHPTSPP